MTFNEYVDENGEKYWVPKKAVWLEGRELIYMNNTVWIYTEFENVFGWVKFDELSTERGVYKILTPENIIQSFF